MTNDHFECYRDFIPEFSDFKKDLWRPFLPHLRINTLKIQPQSVIRTLKEKGVFLKRSTEEDETLFWAPDLESPGNLLEYFLGVIHPQALTSCLVSLVLSPEPESYVLDLCASPGGKTSHMAQLMNNTGMIIANELYSGRHIPLGNTLSRLGVLNTIVTAYQAQEFPLKYQRFDFVLADVPCSGEGRFRITGEHTREKKGIGKEKLSELQKRIILRAFDLLKADGVTVYATCTFDPQENESVIDFLLKNRDAELYPIDIGLKHQPGLTEWRNEKYDEQLQRAIRLYPHHVNSVGFFMARIGRRR